MWERTDASKFRRKKIACDVMWRSRIALSAGVLFVEEMTSTVGWPLSLLQPLTYNPLLRSSTRLLSFLIPPTTPFLFIHSVVCLHSDGDDCALISNFCCISLRKHWLLFQHTFLSSPSFPSVTTYESVVHLTIYSSIHLSIHSFHPSLRPSRQSTNCIVSFTSLLFSLKSIILEVYIRKIKWVPNVSVNKLQIYIWFFFRFC